MFRVFALVHISLPPHTDHIEFLEQIKNRKCQRGRVNSMLRFSVTYIRGKPNQLSFISCANLTILPSIGHPKRSKAHLVLFLQNYNAVYVIHAFIEALLMFRQLAQKKLKRRKKTNSGQ